MAEKDVIYSKINIVKNCLTAIEKARTQEKDDLFLQNIYELNLQRAIQACVDMGHVVIAKEGLGLPNKYRQCFEILHKHQVIDQTLMKKMISMVGFRNISVHDYEAVKPEILKSIISNHLHDFEDYCSVIYHRAQSW
ncbi:MAG: type VII toxin-antitoxin system HepT family RNase toxin [Pseudobdellovibrionaceae bacterium]